MTGPIDRNRSTGLYKLFDGNGVLLYVGIGVPRKRPPTVRSIKGKTED